jgi:hypothetical protein
MDDEYLKAKARETAEALVTRAATGTTAYSGLRMSKSCWRTSESSWWM